MNQNIQNVLNSIVTAFESGDIPEAVAVSSFPIPNIPSMNWSFFNRTIQFMSGTFDSRGYRQWLEVGRHVKKGVRAIYILVPCFTRIKKDESEEEGVETLAYFKAMPVFRAKDTEGKPLEYETIELPELPLIQRAYDWGLDVKAVPGNYRYYGYFNPSRNEIALATPAEKTLFHELSHAADYIIKGNLKSGQDPLQEITAELSAQALARIAGKSAEDTTGNTYRYIKYYSEKLKISPHKACLNVLADTEKVLNLILHGRADGVKDMQEVA